MKKMHFVLLILIISLFSCKEKNSDTNESSKIVQTPKALENNKKIASSIKVKYADLFNTELVGLTKDFENKRHYVDFSSACMCNSPSILIKERKAYLFNYCKDQLPPLSKEPYYTYNIIEINEITSGLFLSLKDEKNKTLELVFNKSNNENIYLLKVMGEFPTDYIGNKICSYFTFNPDKFDVEDCGDFDG
jgi:hypothetical protein